MFYPRRKHHYISIAAYRTFNEAFNYYEYYFKSYLLCFTPLIRLIIIQPIWRINLFYGKKSMKQTFLVILLYNQLKEFES